MPARHIVALGGGGFSMEESPLLDDYILSLARRRRPRIGFIPTASGDAASYLVRFYRAFVPRDCVPTDVTLIGSSSQPRCPPRSADLRRHVLDLDIVYVGGGNTSNMLALWRVYGLDDILREAWSEGVVLAGISAGMICWFSAAITDSFGDLRPIHEGLGLISASACAHYNPETKQRPIYHQAIADGFPAGWGAEDGVGLHFAGDKLVDVVSSRANAKAYRVELRDGQVIETELPARQLL